MVMSGCLLLQDYLCFPPPGKAVVNTLVTTFVITVDCYFHFHHHAPLSGCSLGTTPYPAGDIILRLWITSYEFSDPHEGGKTRACTPEAYSRGRTFQGKELTVVAAVSIATILDIIVTISTIARTITISITFVTTNSKTMGCKNASSSWPFCTGRLF